MEQAIEPSWRLQPDTIVALLDGVDWFASLTRDELAELARSAETVHWDLGGIVCEEGDRGDRCYVLHADAVKVLRRFPDGRRITLARLGPGSILASWRCSTASAGRPPCRPRRRRLRSDSRRTA